MALNKREQEVQQANLDAEKLLLKQLQACYRKAQSDCVARIQELAGRTDMENIQAIVFQVQYQQAIKKQIDSILDTLQTTQFSSVADYLTTSYENGWVGAFYDLQGQGIPLIFPVNQEQVVQAIQNDAKLSKSYYDRLGEDVTFLKKAVKAQVSRGIANGSSWFQVAQELHNKMTNPFGNALYNAMRIARTEGHRVQQQSQWNAINEAKKAGCDIVKQWDSTLDGRTRSTHARLDGQIREIDEPFEVDGKKAMYPGAFGRPEEDIHCRCCCAQRAKWALDEDELRILQERAEYFGLDNSANFEEYRQRFNIASQTASPNLQYTFTPASSISEAEKYARETIGIPNVSYAGVDLRVANAMNESLTNAFNYCPDIKDRMQFYGSAQARNKQLKKELEDYFTQTFEAKGYSPANAEKWGKKYASRFVGRVSSNIYAMAYSGDLSGMGITPELRTIVQRYSGIAVNANLANDFDAFERSVQHDVSVGWHPQQCTSVRSVFDHEFGHQLDYAFGLSGNSEIQRLYYTEGKTGVAVGLSQYASKNMREFIAEGYCEYVNSSSPRPLSTAIGTIIEGKVNGK